jgi:hypoxia up-regulated 1
MRLSFPFKGCSLAAVFILLCVVVQQSCAAVLAIDYGSEWIKAALVKPGIPLQIVLTKDTKRKEQSVVAFKKQERLYGADAYNLVTRAFFKVNLGGTIS